MSYSQTWLEDTTRARGLLVVASVLNRTTTSEQVLYFSTMPFITGDGVAFTPLIANDIEITEAISISGGSANITFGDIEIYNNNGEYDDWVDSNKYIWNNRSIRIYYGDPSWSAADIAALDSVFLKVYDGIIDECKSRDRSVLNWVLRDKLQKLNVALTENIIGNTGVWYPNQANSENIRPIVFGEVHNMTPVLLNPSSLEYLFCDGGAERLIEIRDNGYPIYRDDGDTSGASANLSTGTFNLLRPPAGTITCSVQGKKTTYNVSTQANIASTYRNTIPDTIYMLATKYGSTNTGILAQSDIDTQNFATVLNSFGTAPACGYLVTDRVNLLQVIQELAASIGGSVYCNRVGKLQLLRIGAPTTDTSVTITENDILLNSLVIREKVPIVGVVKLAYAKNWTVQQNLTTYLEEQTKKDLEQEWFIEVLSDLTVIQRHKLSTDPPQRDTYLVNTAQAVTEATRLLNYYKEPKTIYALTATSKMLSLKLGQQVTLQHKRFGLTAGKTGQIIKITPRWCKGLVDLEVII